MYMGTYYILHFKEELNMQKHTKQTGILLAACMLAGSCIAPFSVCAEQTASLPGDLTVDSLVDVADAVLAARFCAEDASAVLTDQGKKNGDVNGNGDVDTGDIQEILEFIARQRTSFSGAAAQQPAEKLTKTVNLLEGIESTAVPEKPVDDTFRSSQFEMTVNLLRETAKTTPAGGNLMISPLSFSQALSMAANGAKGETLDEITGLLGGDLDMDSLNQYYNSYIADLPQSENAKLDIANAAWFIDDTNKISVPPSYLQTIKDYFTADVYRSPFNEQTVSDINGWVKEKTNGMIPSIINGLDPRTIFMLVNALYFDAKWEEPYKDYQVSDRLFYLTEGDAYREAYAQYGPYPTGFGAIGQTDWSAMFTKDGQYSGGTDQSEEPESSANPSGNQTLTVKLMDSTEDIYLENDYVTGFMRPYEGGKYSFVGLLPKGSLTVADCIAEMDGSTLKTLFDQKEAGQVDVSIPKFSSDFSVDLIPVMKELGVEKAFDSREADFTGLNAYGETWIGAVIQKTRIEVDEKGTKAAAATAIAGLGGAGFMPDRKEVILDHPFIYMIVDNKTELPLFIGYLMNPLG